MYNAFIRRKGPNAWHFLAQVESMSEAIKLTAKDYAEYRGEIEVQLKGTR